MSSSYPDTVPERDQWILSRRSERNRLNPDQPYSFLVEEERSEAGSIVPVAVLFLTNRECPWRCLMCDLWKNTLAESVPPGAIPRQIDYALSRLTPARQIKLYNSGSFFDARAIPSSDHVAIAEQVKAFERVIVECHPSLVNDSCLRFRDLLNGQLEVSMGLETVHPSVLDRLNKRMTLDLFAQKAGFLRTQGIALRVFILVKPPFLDEDEGLYWAQRSLDFAFEQGAAVVSLIPTRPGNGALDSLRDSGQFVPPKLATLEAAAAYGLQLGRGRVFMDLWDLAPFASCQNCFSARVERMREMNFRQEILPSVPCLECGGSNGPN